MMKPALRTIALATAGSAIAFAVQAANPIVGGAPMFPTKNIIDNAVNSKDHTTLVAAVKAGGLVGTLEGKGPFTVFAPTNEAFAALPKGTVETLLKPENKATLVKVLTCHVVAAGCDGEGRRQNDQGRWRRARHQDSGRLRAESQGKHGQDHADR